MKKIKKPQLILIAIAVFVFVLLLLLPRVEEPASELEKDLVQADSQKSAATALSDEEDALLDEILSEVEKSENPLDKINWLDSLSKFWDANGDINKAADALFDIAKLINDKPSYLIAGDQYFKAFQDNNNSDQLYSIKSAINAYEQILEINSDDLEVMTSLAVCYIEGSQLLGEAPMKGIGLLKNVLQIDPENINALINLGYFSAKSGQYDLAIKRYEKVLEIDPEFLDAYLYISDIDLSSENNEKAIEYLEAYKSKINDPEVIGQIEIYIEKIKTNNI